LQPSTDLEAAATLKYGGRVEREAQQELEATLAARRELGPGHDDHLIEGFVQRLEREIDRRVDERIAERGPRKRGGSPLHPGNLALCIPIIAVAGGIGGLTGLIVAFIVLGLVFSVAETRR
jgi:hypothetical protein